MRAFSIVFGFLFSVVMQPGFAASSLAQQLKTRPHLERVGGVIEIPAVRYSAPTGYRPLTMTLFVPTADAGPHPLVVYVHGGAWMFDPDNADGLTGTEVLATLAVRGYVVARVSYRLSLDAKFPAALTDVKEAIQWLRSNAATYGADPERIAIWGESAGAYLANMVGTTCDIKEFDAPPPRNPFGPPATTNTAIPAKPSSCVQAVVDWYGPADLSAMDAQALPNSKMKHSEADSPEAIFLGCAIPNCSAEVLKKSNPITYISAKAPPFLIMHGTNDHTVPPKQSQQLYDALRAKNVSAQLVWVENADHVFKGIPQDKAQATLDTVFKYLDQQLGKKPRAADAK